MPETQFKLYRSCDNGGEGVIVAGTMGYDRQKVAADEPASGWLGAGRVGYDGSAHGTVVFDGATFTGSISNAGFAGLDVRCAEVWVYTQYDSDVDMDNVELTSTTSRAAAQSAPSR